MERHRSVRKDEARYDTFSYNASTFSYDTSSRDGPTSRKARYYRPAATSTKSLVAVLVLVASYIALLEILLSMQKIGPQSSSPGRRAQNIDRQIAANSSTATTSLQASSITSQASLDASASASATIPSVAISPVNGAQLSVTTPSTVLAPSSVSAKATSVTVPSVAISPVVSEQLSLTTPTSQLTPSSGTDTAQVQSQLSITTPSTDSFAADKSQLSLTTTSPKISSSISSSLEGTSSIAQQSQLSLATISTKLASSETSTPSEAFTIAPASQLALTTNTPSVQSSSTSEASGSQARTSSSIPASVSASTFLQVSFSTFSSANGSPFGTATFLVLTTSTYQHSATSTTASSASATSSAFVLAKSHVEISGTFTKFDYFLSLYLPKILAVFLQVIWTIVFAMMKMMEPFYQLAKPEGALAQNSILAKNSSTSLSMSSLRALAGHRVMSLAGIIYVAIGLLAPLASESMGVEPTATCVTAISQSQPCAPAWIVYLPAARCLESVLAFLFIAIFILLLMTSRRESGVFEDPSSIKAMAKLLTDPAVVRDFQNVDPDASKAEVREVLANNRYKIGHFEHKGEYRYGFFKMASTPREEPASPRGYSPVENPSLTTSKAPSTHSSKSKKTKDILLVLLVVTLFNLTLAYYFDGNPTDPLNTFFNSNTFGPRFLLSILTVLTAEGFRRLSRETRLLSPYRRLASTPQPSSFLSVPMSSTPYTTIFPALLRGDFFVSWMAMLAVLADVLIIAATGIPYWAAQIHEAGLVSFYLSFGILGGMALGLGGVVARRRGDPGMPRWPDCAAHGWLYLCGGEVGGLGEAELDGREYWFAVGRGADGRERWMVAECKDGVVR